MAVAVALMLPDLPDHPGRTCPLGGMRLDQGVLSAVALLGVLQLTCLAWKHARWVAPRLQGWDLRGLLLWLLLIASARVQAFFAWPMLPLRAFLEMYALLLVCSAVPTLLLGGASRVESKSGLLGKWTHRVLVMLLVLRVASAGTLIGLQGRMAPREACLRYAYAADAGWVVVTLLIALLLHFTPGGGDASEKDAVSARRGGRLLWMLTVFLVTTHETVLMLISPTERSLEINAVLAVYEYFGLIVAGASCFDAGGDPLLLALCSDKAASCLARVKATLTVHDVLGQIPFDKPLFFSLRSALAESEGSPIARQTTAGGSFVTSVPSSAPAAGFGASFTSTPQEIDSEGESIYGAAPAQSSPV